jgi:NCAIR mutase (PurE)-related protein
MTEAAVRQLLEQVSQGRINTEEAVEQLCTLPFREAAGVLADTHRLLRQGFPEAVFAEGKTLDQVGAALTLLSKAQGAALATRVSEAMGEELKRRFSQGCYDPVSRIFEVGRLEPASRGLAGVVCAGTSDLPVAEEAARTLEFCGHSVTRIVDVGVAGLHRLLARLADLRGCSVLIVVAGMEGALPGVVGGLVACPVIAVPTSVGYGASFKGLSALLTMLNGCSSGVSVVNIDNGYGAAVAARRILLQPAP